MTLPWKKERDPRTALRTTATFATGFAVLGHTVLGFEQSLAQVFVGVAIGLACALLFETVDARANHRPPPFLGGGALRFVDWLLAPYMTSLTLAFLLFPNDHLGVMAFTIVAAVGSKYIFRVNVNGRARHFLNPSNAGLVLVVFVFPWVGVLPWQYTENVRGVWNWILPGIVFLLGTRINLLFTKRMPLIFAFLGSFALQALVRWQFFGAPPGAVFAPFTGIAFVLFTFYMFTDPMTSPTSFWGQVAFGALIAFGYGILVEFTVFYSLFFPVALGCTIRGAYLFMENRAAVRAKSAVKVEGAPATPADARAV